MQSSRTHGTGVQQSASQQELGRTRETNPETKNIGSLATGDLTEAEIQESLKKELQMMSQIKAVTDHIASHKLFMKHDRPIKQMYSPRNPPMKSIINKQVDELLAQNLIESTHCVVIVETKNKEWRLWVNYRQLNEHSERDASSVTRMDHIFNQLREAKYISKLDPKSGYWQIPMGKSSKQYTDFCVPGRGQFQWKVMPFVLHTTPATFQRALDSVIGTEMEPFAFAYLDEIVVIGGTKRGHLEKQQ